MIDTTLFIAFTGFAFTAAMTPGPNNLMLMSSGAMFGFKRTIPHICGVFIGFNFLMLAAMFGLDIVITQFPFVLNIVKVFGAIWLTWMGLKFLQATLKASDRKTTKETKSRSHPFRFYQAILFQWVNPKALVMAGLTAGTYVGISDNFALRTTLICGTFFVFGIISASTWAVAGSTLNRLMSSGRSAQTLNLIMGTLLIGTAIMILMTKTHI